MHTLFLLSALLLAAVLGGLGALVLRLVPAGGRRPLALAVLMTPAFVLAVATLHLVPRLWPDCAPLVGWDLIASLALLVGLGGVATGALALNVARLFLVERLLRACPPLDDGALTARLATLAEAVGVPAPAVRLLRTEAPLAVTGGPRRPTIVLSSWLIDHLERRELEAVLAHELAHLARRDHLTRWLGRLLRDATLYLPGGWYALRVLEADEELGADALAVEVTRRPLAMANALGKVWRGALAGPAPLGLAGVPGYAATSAELLEERLHRLVEGRSRQRSALPGRLAAGAGVLSVGELTPRLLALSANALPLVCSLRSVSGS